MTGYVKAFKPEMKMRDYEIYKGIYCSLCKQLGKRYTPLAQLFLNYDLVFFLAVKLSVSADCPETALKHCQYNPFVKCSCIKTNDLLKTCSDLAIIISYYKIKDNIRDEKGFKKISMYLLMPFISLMHRKAKRLSPAYEKPVAAAVTEQKNVEKNKDAGLDMAAEPTARALSEIFTIGENDEHQIKVMERLGYLIGRWVYIIDAVDDIEDDLSRNSFNPFQKQFTKAGLKTQNDNFHQYARQVLLTTSGEAALAFELLETKRYRAILENILYEGLAGTADNILNKYRRCDLEKSL